MIARTKVCQQTFRKERHGVQLDLDHRTMPNALTVPMLSCVHRGRLQKTEAWFALQSSKLRRKLGFRTATSALLYAMMGTESLALSAELACGIRVGVRVCQPYAKNVAQTQVACASFRSV